MPAWSRQSSIDGPGRTRNTPSGVGPVAQSVESHVEDPLHLLGISGMDLGHPADEVPNGTFVDHAGRVPW